MLILNEIITFIYENKIIMISYIEEKMINEKNKMTNF